MVKRCAWGTCKTDSRYPERLIKDGKVINFHPFPSEKKFKERRELWIRSCSGADDFKCTKDSYIMQLAFCGRERADRRRSKSCSRLPATASIEKRFVIYVYTVCLHITFYSVIHSSFKDLRHGRLFTCIHDLVLKDDLTSTTHNLHSHNV